MALDLPTIFAVTVFANAVAGVLLLLSWTQYRNIPALAVWGLGFVMGSIGTALLGGRAQIGTYHSILFANASFALGYGVMWAGVRLFVGRDVPIPIIFVGAGAWIIACQFEWFYQSPMARLSFIAVIIGCYLLMCAWEFWRSRERALFSRWPIIFVLLFHATAFFIRIPIASAWLARPEGKELRVDWIAAVGAEILFFVFCFAYLLGSMAHERMVLRHRTEARKDALTGIANRRDFFARGENIVRRARIGEQPASLILFDLDEFKGINDTYGHPVGDRVLQAFCEVAIRSLRPTDLFARVGGEEFACLLEETSSDEAELIAERIRTEFEEFDLELGPTRVHATVSAGIASLEEGIQALSELILVADQALYRAKASGRNRLERAPGVVVDNRRLAATG